MSASLLALDLRSSLPPCRHQGQRETCASFAATAAHEMARSGRWFSEEHAHWASQQLTPRTTEARPVSEVLAGIADIGHAAAEDWQYGSPPYTDGIPDGATTPAAISRRRIPEGWHEVGALELPAVADLLQSGTSVVLSLGVVPGEWLSAAKDGWVSGGAASEAPVGHAVAAVGVHVPVGTGPAAIIFRNSAGPKWGDGGYGYLTAEYLKAHCWTVHIVEKTT
jgi:C1A family cysteine protease